MHVYNKFCHLLDEDPQKILYIWMEIGSHVERLVGGIGG